MGTLYIISTPIGNFKDITLRALEALEEVDFILCEDTRQTIKLLNHYEISKPLISYFQHSKISKIEYIIDLLKQGKNLALVTDAGTPGISDPGNLLIKHILFNFRLLPSDSLRQSDSAAEGEHYPLGREASEGMSGRGVEKNNSTPSQSPPQLKPSASWRTVIASQLRRGRGRGAQIIPIPGPSAVTAALSISGFPADKFIFMGFPPHKKRREKFFKEVGEAKYTVVFYESVHRILKTLEQLLVSLRGVPRKRGDEAIPRRDREVAMFLPVARDDERQVVVCRELTKQFETIYRGNIEEVLEQVKNDKIKGEYVVVVSAK